MGPRLLRALLHRAASEPPDSDAELLGRFAESRDEPAFAELVRRYGGLVWGQCRNLLPSEADAEDAFQATFLVLARRPDAVRSAVGPYLHGVAYRVCLNARRLAGRRKKREAVVAVLEAERPVADSAWDAALATVHDELHRLPDPQREAFVLCVLEGRGLTDAAGHLGVKLGTLSARLSRAKQTLMDRLTAKGVVAGVAAATALAPAGVTAAVAAKAVHAAIGSAGGSVVIPESVLALTHGVTRMVTSKLKLLAAGVLLACGFGLSVGTGLVATAQDKPKPKGVSEGPSLAEIQRFKEGRRDKSDEQQLAEAVRLVEARAQKDADQRRLLELEVAELKKALDEQLAKAQPAKDKAAPQPEFKYVPIAGDGMVTAKNFEKLVAENEKGGYVFVGSAPLSGKKGREKGPDEPVTTLVFRKVVEKAVANPPKALLGDRVREYEAEYERLVAQEQLAKAEAERQLRARQDQIVAERDRLKEESKQLQDKETRLRAEIDALQERLKQQPAAKPVAPALAVKPEKMYDVNFDKVPWPNVIEWLAKETGLTVVGSEKPAGTCTIKFGRKVAIAELMDTFNETLAQQKLILARGEQTLQLWPVDKPRPQVFVRSVRVEDLDKFGKSEVVKVVLPLDGITSEDAEKLAKKRMSQLGEVTTIAEKQLVIIDRASEVRAVIAALREQLKQQPVAPAVKPAFTTVDLGPNAAQVLKAVTAAADVKFKGRQNAPQMVLGGNELQIWADPADTAWLKGVIEALKK